MRISLVAHNMYNKRTNCREYRVEIGRGVSRNIGQSTRITYFVGKSSSLPKDSPLLRENQRFTFRSDKVISVAPKYNILLFPKKYNLYFCLFLFFMTWPLLRVQASCLVEWVAIWVWLIVSWWSDSGCIFWVRIRQVILYCSYGDLHYYSRSQSDWIWIQLCIMVSLLFILSL